MQRNAKKFVRIGRSQRYAEVIDVRSTLAGRSEPEGVLTRLQLREDGILGLDAPQSNVNFAALSTGTPLLKEMVSRFG
jgi:hypothetical protein